MDRYITTRVPIEKLRIGDSVLDGSGNPVSVTDLEPYRHPSIETPGVTIHGPQGWTMTVFEGEMVRVAS